MYCGVSMLRCQHFEAPLFVLLSFRKSELNTVVGSGVAFEGERSTMNSSNSEEHCPVQETRSNNTKIENGELARAGDALEIHRNFSGMYGKLKYVSLGLLVTQQTVMPLLVRYSRVRKTEQMFLASSAVLMNEILKLLFCVSVLTVKERSLSRFFFSLHKAVILERMETLKVCVPSLIFIIQNNLYFVALSNLEPSTYLITYQLRILTTAFFFVTILKKTLSKPQWLSLFILMCGVSMVQLQDTSSAPDLNPKTIQQNYKKILGLGAVMTMCITSGFGGVYFEKVLKSSSTNIWMQNIRLALLGIPLSLGTMLFKDWERLNEGGMTQGFDWLVWLLTFFNSVGGILIASVMKYADNILKAYAQASAIILAFLGSAIIFDFAPSISFVLGAVFVIMSIYLYAKFPPAVVKP